MCANYRTVTSLDRLVSYFRIYRADGEPPFEPAKETFPTQLAPFIRLDENGRRLLQQGNFGLVPNWCKEIKFGRNTYNSRSETVASKNSFRDAWKNSQRCIVPAEVLFEQNYESGSPVRWAFEKADGTPFAIAGLYVDHAHLKYADGKPVQSFTMLTVNAETHPVFKRMHAPNDEKRMVVILEPGDTDAWLTCSPEEATHFFRQWVGPIKDYPAPINRQKREKPAQSDTLF